MPGKTKSIPEIQKELKTKRRHLSKLRAERRKLQTRLASIDRKIESISGFRVAPASKPKRRRGKPLADYIVKVLARARKPMRTKDIAAAVKKSGYKSNSKDFYNIVATTLRDERFKRVERGQYTLAK